MAFAIFDYDGILAIEAGLLTPPFGLIVYTVKGTVPDPEAARRHAGRGGLWARFSAARCPIGC